LARAVRFTKPEREEIRAGLEWRAKLTVNRPGRGPEPTKSSKVALAALAKLDASEKPVEKVSSGVSCAVAIEAFRKVLGPRLVVPPNPGAPYWVTMTRGLQSGGYTAEQCRRIAEVAAVEWQGRIKAESLVRQGAELLTREAPQEEYDSAVPNLTDDDMEEL
jgi:hypothetical protein